MSEKEIKGNLERIPIDDPKVGLGVSPQLLTVAADYIKVHLNTNTHSCTLMVYQKHPFAKQTQRGLMLDGYQDEEIMEIKISMESVLGVGEYLHMVLNELRSLENPNDRTYFGPTYIIEKPKK